MLPLPIRIIFKYVKGTLSWAVGENLNTDDTFLKASWNVYVYSQVIDVLSIIIGE